MVPPLELKLNRVICPKSVATSKTSVLGGYHIYIFVYRVVTGSMRPYNHQPTGV